MSLYISSQSLSGQGALGIVGDYLNQLNTTIISMQTNLNISGSSTLQSSLTVSGNTLLNSTLINKGDASYNSSLTVSGLTLLNNTLIVLGATTLGSTLNVSSTVTTLLVQNGTSDITLGNANNVPGGFVNIGVMNNFSNSYPNVDYQSNNLSIGWNKQFGEAEIDFFNNWNSGFNFYGRNSSTSIYQVARLRGDNISSYSFSFGPAAYASFGANRNGTSIGVNVGNATMSGDTNTLVGSNAGNALTNGYSNTCIGSQTGRLITSGYRNTCLGAFAGENILDGFVNVCLGYSAGQTITSGAGNVCTGQFSGSNITTGYNNVCIGNGAGTGGTAITTGGQNIYIGLNAYSSANNVNNETVLGAGITGKGSNTTSFRAWGGSNVYIRENFGYNNIGGFTIDGDGTAGTNGRSLVLGRGDGAAAWHLLCGLNNELRIHFSSNSISVYAYLTPSSNGLITISDARFKKEITDIPNILDKLLALRPVHYLLISEEDGTQPNVGFIAQEVLPLFPNVVYDENPDHIALNYVEFIPYLVKGIQEQQALILKNQSELLNQKSLLVEQQALILKNQSELLNQKSLLVEQQNLIQQHQIELLNQKSLLVDQQKQIDELKLLINQK